MARPLTAATAAAEAVGRGEQVEPLQSPLVEANILPLRSAKASSELKRRREHSEFLMRELAHRGREPARREAWPCRLPNRAAA